MRPWIDGAWSFSSQEAPLAGDRRILDGGVIWLTGLSSAGKTTLGVCVAQWLSARGWKVELLDGDQMRQQLCRDLQFSKKDREENVRRIAAVAELLVKHGVIAIVSVISPYRSGRDEARRRISRFIEVYVNAPVEVCEQRDTKGLYRKARARQLTGFTGIDDPYEPPLRPEVECRTDKESVTESANKILRCFESIFTMQSLLVPKTSQTLATKAIGS